MYSMLDTNLSCHTGMLSMNSILKFDAFSSIYLCLPTLCVGFNV